MDPAAARCPSLRHVVPSGEALPAETMRRALATLPHAAMWNLYGPTEASVDVTSWRCRELEAGEAVPIGRPVANVECLVLDQRGERVEPGATGELCLGGVQVALGYVGQPELTRERFVEIPGVEGPVYRTGDLARWRESGELDYLGRADAQVKVAGVPHRAGRDRGGAAGAGDGDRRGGRGRRPARVGPRDSWLTSSSPIPAAASIRSAQVWASDCRRSCFPRW